MIPSPVRRLSHISVWSEFPSGFSPLPVVPQTNQLNGFQRVTAPALEQKIGKLMAGSLKEIRIIQAESIRTSGRLQQQIAVTNVTFGTPYEGIQVLNKTLWSLIGSEVALKTSPVGLQFAIIGPTPPSFPDQGPIGAGRT